MNNLLHSIKKADNLTSYADFTYDACSLSQFIGRNKLSSGSSRNYIWDYAFDGMPSVTYQLSNHLGSVSYRLNSSGTVVDTEEPACSSRRPLKANRLTEQYYPFGDSSVRTWSKKRYRYVGKEKDAEPACGSRRPLKANRHTEQCGLYYYGARYYSAWTCRFISVDPLAREYSQLTPYNYAGNKPINHLDIDGMQSSEDGGNEPVSGGGGNQQNQSSQGGHGITQGGSETNVEKQKGNYDVLGRYKMKKGTYDYLSHNSSDGNKSLVKAYSKFKVLRKLENNYVNFGFVNQLVVENHWNPNYISHQIIPNRKETVYEFKIKGDNRN